MFFKRKITESLDYEGDIILIGPICSGKTTFLAALSALNMAKNKSPILKEINPQDDYSEKLSRRWTDIVMKGGKLAGTNIYEDISELPHYDFSLRFEVPIITLFSILSKQINLQFDFKEFSGSLPLFPRDSNLAEILLDSYYQKLYYQCVSDLTDFTQIFILFDALSSNRDKQYAEQITFLENSLNKKLQENNQNKNQSNYRIAIGFYKFEQSNVYLYLDNLNNFVELKFYHLQTAMNQWKTKWNCSVEYFACSGFGIIEEGELRKPNCKNDPNPRGGAKWGTLRNPEEWQPFGLVAPIYWLLTGERDERIDEL
ncbi:hypothetical protein [Crocosphaera sp.]|uniref:hypothetical protein n=1 Tax=Crocosphaera sp. TaxID=2729996 RepID=UPI002609A981|nr:hypothetical protein [Crocosphaera sp.]MDJ0579206.1 hypothetical protein [Crocosphaera sp.]